MGLQVFGDICRNIRLNILVAFAWMGLNRRHDQVAKPFIGITVLPERRAPPTGTQEADYAAILI